VKRELKC